MTDEEQWEATATSGTDEEHKEATATSGADEEQNEATATTGTDEEQNEATATSGTDEEQNEARATSGTDEETRLATATSGTEREQTEPAPAAFAPYARPLPEPTAVSAPFWEGARQHRLMLQRSQRTGRHVFYPRAVSPFGAGDELEWVEASGRGTVYSYTVARRATAPQWAGEVPYVIAIVELAENVRMTANIVGCAPGDVRIGMAVEAAYDDVTPEVTLVQFRPLNTVTVSPPG